MIKKRLASLFMTSAMLCGFVGWLPAGYGGLDISASASGSIEAALQWAVAAANDDSHGYSQSNRWGPDYDCSSFVITALRSAGFETSSASYTGNMRKDLIANGFTWIPWSSIGSEGNLQRGDILLKEGSHTEFYLGNGKNVGAHKDYGHPESGDQTGGEVSVSGYYYHPWDGVLRYEASSSPIGCVDVLETRGSEVHVAGWAFDPDNPNANLQIHVYAGSKGVNEIVANLESSDVNAVYNISGKHRFDKWLNMGVSGTQTVSVYAIDATGDGNTKIDETSLYFGAMSASLDADFKALIVNTNSNKPIMQDNNGNVVLTTEARTNYDATLWHFLKNDDGTYSIYSYKNGSRRGYAMGVTNNSDTNGAKIICSTPNLSGVNQKWRIDVRTSDGTMKLVPKCSSTDKCLEISGGGKTDGTAAQIRTADGTAPQKFKFIKLDENRDKIDYRLSTSSTSVIQNSNVKITVGGTTPYVCEYKFCVTDPNGKETTVNNGCNPVYSFNPSITGNYKVYALLKSPVQESIAANAKNKAITIKVTCNHSYTLKVVAPSGTEQGYTLHTCTKCGDTFKDNYTTNQDPVGHVDEISGGAGKIHIKGWAYDPDNMSKSLKIHVYIGGKAGSVGKTAEIIADVESTDLGISGKHRFDTWINTDLRGDQPVYIYAINSEGGYNPIIGSKTVTIDEINHDPVGYLERVEFENGKIRVKGWAYDPDDSSKSLPIHVYIGGKAGSGAECHVIKSAIERSDVNSYYKISGIHGFDEWMETSAWGETPVYVYAINNEGGYNPCIGNGTVTVDKMMIRTVP